MNEMMDKKNCNLTCRSIKLYNYFNKMHVYLIKIIDKKGFAVVFFLCLAVFSVSLKMIFCMLIFRPSSTSFVNTNYKAFIMHIRVEVIVWKLKRKIFFIKIIYLRD